MKQYQMMGLGKQTLQAVIRYLDTKKGVNPTYKQKMARLGKGSEWQDIAGEIFSYMPTHYFKFLHILEKEEINSTIKELDDITILDIGCGIGTVTHCLNDYISKEFPNKEVDIMCLGFEPCEHRGELFEVAFKRYNNKNIQHKFIRGCFPEDIKMAIDEIRNNNVFIVTSNLFNWIRDKKDNNILKEEIKKGLFYIINELKEKNIWMINTEMNKDDNSMVNTLDEIYKALDKKDMYFTKYTIVHPNEISFINPKYCLAYDTWKKKKPYVLTTEYHYVYTQIYGMEDTFEKAIDKVEQFLSTCSICDQLEIAYIKNNICNINELLWGYVNNYNIGSDYYEYIITKPNKGKRYLLEEDSLDNIYETIILMNKGIIVDRQQNDDVSYGNRLDKRESRNICIPYGKMYYKRYNEDIKKIIASRRYSSYFKIDIKQYYNSIDHRKLMSILEQKYQYMIGFTEKYLDREYEGCIRDKKGIPQGPEISAVLANIYMGEFDEWFTKKYPQHKVLRYVDDIIIFIKNNEKGIDVRSNG